MGKKSEVLSELHNVALTYRQARLDEAKAREGFINAIKQAVDFGVTHDEISRYCFIDPDTNNHISRQRVSQFVKERK
jgi:hypothetical protein